MSTRKEANNATQRKATNDEILLESEFRLTEKQIKFAKSFISGGNRKQAALDAGYKDNPGVAAYKTLQLPHVQKYIELLTKERRQASKLTQERVLVALARIGKKAEIAGDYRSANQSWQLIGKQLGMYVDRQLIQGQIQVGTGADYEAAADLPKATFIELLNRGGIVADKPGSIPMLSVPGSVSDAVPVEGSDDEQ